MAAVRHQGDGAPHTPDARRLVFEEHRAFLFSLAYRMLGSAADAEDIVQDAYVRWHDAPGREVEYPGRYLGTVVTRLCLDHHRSARVRREVYVGPWLPEPLVEPPDGGSPPDAFLWDSLSLAFLHLLERLSMPERAAFLLGEVFGFPHAEVARITGRSEAATRKSLERARDRLAVGRARFGASPREAREVTERFMEACDTGDVEALLDLLAPDAVVWSDGGGKAPAALRPILGADRVSRFITGVRSKWTGLRMRIVRVNGQPGLLVDPGHGQLRVMAFGVAGGHIHDIFLISNPDKLRTVDHRWMGPRRPLTPGTSLPPATGTRSPGGSR